MILNICIIALSKELSIPIALKQLKNIQSLSLTEDKYLNTYLHIDAYVMATCPYFKKSKMLELNQYLTFDDKLMFKIQLHHGIDFDY